MISLSLKMSGERSRYPILLTRQSLNRVQELAVSKKRIIEYLHVVIASVPYSYNQFSSVVLRRIPSNWARPSFTHAR